MGSSTLALLAAFYAGSACASTVHHGKMSMWSATADTIVGYKSEGSACKFADKDMGGLSAPTARTPYILSKKYCAVNREMFGGGEICGACYRITYHGDHEQGLGRPGSDVIQVVDSGSWATFDCHMTAFHEITDYSTGFFPITYEQVPCDTAGTGPVAGVLHSDYYTTKLVFSNLHYPVKTASVSIEGQEYPLKLIGGWWYVWTGGVQGSVEFKLIEEDGEMVAIKSCFGGWQNRRTGDGCSDANPQHKLASQSAATLPAVDGSAAPALAGNLRGIVPTEEVRTGNSTGDAANSTGNGAVVFLFP